MDPSATTPGVTEPKPHAFLAVPERNTADNFLRTTQQHHVQLSVMADLKANIIITVSSIVLTMTLGRMSEPGLRISAITLMVFTTLALLTAILAVLPKYRPLRLKGGQALPENFNILFFGHFAELPRDRFLVEVATSMSPDGRIYETMAKDIYSLGYYLAHFKYRYLRLSYLFFLSGFVLASLEQLARFVF
jgi:hypothetical protein